jgi:hypothetical protein
MRRSLTHLFAAVTLAVLTSGTTLSAQSAAPAPCSAPEHRQFDFWVGEWEVVDTAGSPAGRNRITREMGGCVLREEWTSAGGGSGSSFNIYDAATGQWHQTWVDTGGTLLLLDGGLRSEGVMVMEGDRPGPNGTTVRNRITWTRESPDTVRQLWEVSDDGTTWRAIFNGLYRRSP